MCQILTGNKTYFAKPSIGSVTVLHDLTIIHMRVGIPSLVTADLNAND